MEVEKEIELNYPSELKEFLLEQSTKATYKMQKEAYENVLHWINDRKIVDVVMVDIEPEDCDWRD